jgi:hypothetical protein
MAVFTPRLPYGRRGSSACRDSAVIPPLTFRSLHVLCSPRRWCARTVDIAVTACHPLAATAVCSPHQFPVSAGYLLTAPLVCPPRRHSGHRVSSACPNGGVPTTLTLRSPRIIRSPRRLCAHTDDFRVPACPPLAATAVFAPRSLCDRRMASARRDGGLLAPLTIRSPRVICSLRSWCTRPADNAVTVYHPLASRAEFTPN